MDRRKFIEATGGLALVGIMTAISPRKAMAITGVTTTPGEKPSYVVSLVSSRLTANLCAIRVRLTSLQKLNEDIPFVLMVATDNTMTNVVFQQSFYSGPASSYMSDARASLSDSNKYFAQVRLVNAPNIRSKIWTIPAFSSAR